MKASRSIAGAVLALAISGFGTAQAQTSQVPPNHKVARRQVNQQARIHQGVKSGQLTKGETRRVERQQNRIQRTKRIDKAANGGKLTPKDKAHLNRMQNRASRHIYRAKHNSRVQK
jgi:hypothetical protein